MSTQYIIAQNRSIIERITEPISVQIKLQKSACRSDGNRRAKFSKAQKACQKLLLIGDCRTFVICTVFSISFFVNTRFYLMEIKPIDFTFIKLLTFYKDETFEKFFEFYIKMQKVFSKVKIVLIIILIWNNNLI